MLHVRVCAGSIDALTTTTTTTTTIVDRVLNIGPRSRLRSFGKINAEAFVPPCPACQTFRHYWENELTDHFLADGVRTRVWRVVGLLWFAFGWRRNGSDSSRFIIAGRRRRSYATCIIRVGSLVCCFGHGYLFLLFSSMFPSTRPTLPLLTCCAVSQRKSSAGDGRGVLSKNLRSANATSSSCC